MKKNKEQLISVNKKEGGGGDWLRSAYAICIYKFRKQENDTSTQHCNQDKLKKSKFFSEVLPDLQWVSGALNNNNESGCVKEDISKPQEKKKSFFKQSFS